MIQSAIPHPRRVHDVCQLDPMRTGRQNRRRKSESCRHARRAARRLRLLVSAGLLAAGGPRRARGRAGLHGGRPRRPRRAVRRAALLQGGPGAGHPADRRGGADARSGPPRVERLRCPARGDAARLPQPVPADHAHEGRRGEGGGAPRLAMLDGLSEGLVALPGVETLARERRPARDAARARGARRRPSDAARRGSSAAATSCSTCSATAVARRRPPTRRCWRRPTRSRLAAVATNGVRHARPRGARSSTC